MHTSNHGTDDEETNIVDVAASGSFQVRNLKEETSIGLLFFFLSLIFFSSEKDVEALLFAGKSVKVKRQSDGRTALHEAAKKVSNLRLAITQFTDLYRAMFVLRGF
jgi:hypothetical protein